MMRILKIVPKRGEYRTDRMKVIQSWMTAHGWHLADYAGEAGSAAFARDEDAPRLSLFAPTRWLPGPDALKPREWFRTARSDLRWVILPGGAAFALLVAILSLMAPNSFLSSEALKREEEAKWRYVSAPKLNVREAPNRTAQIVAILYRNQRVLLEGKVNAEWVKLGPPSRGYVASRYLNRQPAVQAARQATEQPRPAARASGDQSASSPDRNAPPAPRILLGTERSAPQIPPVGPPNLPQAPASAQTPASPSSISSSSPVVKAPASLPALESASTVESSVVERSGDKPSAADAAGKPQEKSPEESPVKSPREAPSKPPPLPSGGVPALPPPPPKLPSINTGG